MAYKTMLRQLISKWGIMSIDMVTALDADMAVINEDGTKNYVDNENDIIDVPAEEVREVPETETPQKESADKDKKEEQPEDAAAALFG